MKVPGLILGLLLPLFAGAQQTEYYGTRVAAISISGVESQADLQAIPLRPGDILTPEDVTEVLRLGADGAMIGRGAIQNPWVFEQTKHFLATGEHLPQPGMEERIELCIRHLKDNAAYRGEGRGVTSFRKFYAYYLKGMPDSSHVRIAVMQHLEVAPIEELLRAYLAQLGERATV